MLNATQLDEFHQNGYIIVPDLFDPNEMKLALRAMEQIFYGQTFTDYLVDFDAGKNTDSVEPKTTKAIPHYGETEFGRAQFPCGVDELDRLIENDTYLDVFSECLAAKDMNYCNAHLFMRSGPTDKRHSEHPWQGYHIDHYTNCFLPPTSDIGRYDYVNSGVYLHDVDEDSAPMHVIPGSHLQAFDILPRMAGQMNDIRQISQFAKPVSTTAKAGSVLFYSSYLVHAAVPFRNRRKQRALWTLSMSRADTCRWTKLANPWVAPEQSFIKPFWETTTPRVRTLFGWPAPGSDYYCQETIENLTIMYPNMNLAPYR